MLLALTAVAGVSNAITQPAINLFMADQVPIDRQGIAFGIKQSAIPVAVLVGGLALPLVALPLGWREAFVLFAVVALGVAAVVRRSAARFVAPRTARAPPDRAANWWSPRSARRSQRRAELARGLPGGLGGRHRNRRRRRGRARRRGQRLSLITRIGSASARTAARTTASAPSSGYWPRGRPDSRCWRRQQRLFVAGAVIAFAIGWGWPGLFNLAVVDLNRDAPGAATGVTQTGIYVGAAAGPLAYGLLSAEIGYRAPGACPERSACWPPRRSRLRPG